MLFGYDTIFCVTGFVGGIPVYIKRAMILARYVITW